MNELENKLMTGIMEQKEVTLTLEEINILVNLVRLHNDKIQDDKAALDPNSYEILEEE